MSLNYSSDFALFREKFCNEELCVEALFKARWPDGFRCPKCESPNYSTIRTRRLPLYECRSCRHQTSIISGTIMEKSSTPLILWFQAIYILSYPGGASSAYLSRTLKITYKTAWLISHKIRYAMQQAENQCPLTGNVRVQQSYYGYTFFSDAQHPLVIGGSVNEHNEIQQIKIMQPEPNQVDNMPRRVTKWGIQTFINKHTDGKTITLCVSSLSRHPMLIRIRKSVTDWLYDRFSGIGAKHLQAYLSEFCYRFNALGLKNTPAFGQLLQQCAVTTAIIYKELTREKPILTVPWVIWGGKARWKGRYLTYWGR